MLLGGEEGEGGTVEGKQFNGEGPKLEIKIPEADKIDRNVLDPPSKHGNAPTFKSDGSPVEIHHAGQKAEGPFQEMHKADHRMGENYKNNHSNESSLSKAERKEFTKAKTNYWKKEYPKTNK